MSRFYKKDIDFHGDRPYSPRHPAINVKVYQRTLPDTVVMDKFGCDEKTAEKAIEFAYESAQERFWEDAIELAKEIFGKGAKVYSEGRSGGWLVVHGLTEVQDWDAIKVGKWGRFVHQIEDTMKGYLDPEGWLEEIESNRWAEMGAEKYNFIETRDGKMACVVDIVRIQTEAKVAYLASL
jgi:hypothetical protein